MRFRRNRLRRRRIRSDPGRFSALHHESLRHHKAADDSSEILTDCAKADAEFSPILLRYFDPVGAHESGKIGEDPEPGLPTTWYLISHRWPSDVWRS